MENVPYIKCKCINEEKMWSDLIAKRTSVQETTSYYHSFLSNMILFIAYYLFSIFLSYLYGLYENNVWIHITAYFLVFRKLPFGKKINKIWLYI